MNPDKTHLVNATIAAFIPGGSSGWFVINDDWHLSTLHLEGTM